MDCDAVFFALLGFEGHEAFEEVGLFLSSAGGHGAEGDLERDVSFCAGGIR